ncbi:Lug1p Ecym_6144 [Eremothecium cymbalariae DBVPG|uniref:F-box domain-containing protein n=1 Tax=Eremothecium cymbalariae (strain CBS 270.75 / DBVPG 7215 / KCTC 17166 / NRRL Y-17582) TaxID=931890 RepID=G8JV56_ERECY|nr:hypothetical protein Ecym_6144 [Eremothecium cymbalariae DBVPG\
MVKSSHWSLQLPPEIVYEILSYQFRDLMSNDHPPSSEKFHSNLKIFLRSNSTVNRTFNHVCRVLTYRYLNFTTARSFNKVLELLKGDKTGLNKLIQVVDFQELSSIGLGRTQEMNKMIKNLTNETLYEFLQLTAQNLREFLASEHIQGDFDENVIYYLLRPGSTLNVVDFCGCSGSKFTDTFINVVNRLYDGSTDEVQEQNYQLTSLGLNDCTDLPTAILGKLLKYLPELQKLDLSHTSIDDYTLVNDLPHWKNITHLSLAECSQLTPRAILEFFSYQPSMTDDKNCTLQWLNLKAHKHTSSWTETQTMFLLKKLCRYGHNTTLEYLNIDGLPLNYSEDNRVIKMALYYQCQDTLKFIKLNFPKLKSLSIRKANVTVSRLVKFLSPFEENDIDNIEFSSSVPSLSSQTFESTQIPVQRLKFLDISGNSCLNKWTMGDPTLFTCSDSIVAFELPFECWEQIESRRNSEAVFMKPKNTFGYNGKPYSYIIQDFSTVDQVKWKCYLDASYGRRYWIFKTDAILNGDDLDARGSITRYDTQGNKIIDITKQPDFLKFAQNKIMLGCGIVPLSGIRRKKTYRETKPPISRFFGRDGKISMGGSLMIPRRTPRLPRGMWRLMHSDQYTRDVDMDDFSDGFGSNPDMLSSVSSSEYNFGVLPLVRRSGTRDGLYLDRSVADLIMVGINETIVPNSADSYITVGSNHANITSEDAESNYDYLNNPDLQRRRSQFSLFRFGSRAITNNDSIPAHPPILTRALKSHNIMGNSISSQTGSIPSSYKYLEDQSPLNFSPETNKLYKAYFQLVEEYEVFGCIERGMYRYYSLRT